jgi:hypothetical protein
MEHLLSQIAAHPEAFSDTVYLPCPLRQVADVFLEVLLDRPGSVYLNLPGERKGKFFHQGGGESSSRLP